LKTPSNLNGFRQNFRTRATPRTRQAGKFSGPQNLASLYSTGTKLGSTLEAKLTLSSHFLLGGVGGIYRGVKLVLWAKVGPYPYPHIIVNFILFFFFSPFEIWSFFI
jgi:hypothetical protein